MRVAAAVAGLLIASGTLALEPPQLPADRAAVRELRLGVVCYGGVSLAIYMFGTTRELHHLALASAALEHDVAVEGAAGRGWQALPASARHYYRALVEQWEQEKVRTRVAIDVISGTSAGGINGIVLAKALAHNRPVVGLRRLWFEEADIRRLATGRPWALRAALRLLRGKPALGGDAWLKQLYLALNGMDEGAGAAASPLPSLVPPGQSLDLLVTATDFYGSERLLEIGDPATSWETRHDQVFRFAVTRNGDGGIGATQFARNDNAALAFAARASASFPVAFPAIRIADLERALGEPVDAPALASRLFGERLAERHEAGAPAALADRLYLVDGGVLDNYPFGIAYRRVSRRVPVRETRRVFLYLEPDPRATAPTDRAQPGEPTALQMFWRAQASIPGAEPIAQDLLEMARHNQRVDRIAQILRRDEEIARAELAERAEGNVESVARRIELALQFERNALADPAALSDRLGKSAPPPSSGAPQDGAAGDGAQDEIRRLRLRVEADAAGSLPVMEEAYLRLRVHSVVDQLGRVVATALCGLAEDSEGPQSALMRAIVFDWSRRQGLLGSSIDAGHRADFLHAFDLGYLRRRLRFVADWLNVQYDPGRYGEYDYGLTREQLETSQAAISRQVDRLTEVLRGGRLEQLGLGEELARARRELCVPFDAQRSPAEQAASVLDEPVKRTAIADLDAALSHVLLDLQDAVLADLYAEFVAQTAGWNDAEASRAVLARYLGFAYWDRVSYPYTAFSGVGELARIHIMRFSPSDTHAVSGKHAGKLAGSGLAHFGAFFDRDGRERDYVWGRLDGAERVLALLRIPPGAAKLSPLLEAILAEEAMDGEVRPANLDFFAGCLERRGSC